MVECECICRSIVTDCPRVLIDTWWNVNVIDINYINEYACVLIDTWWNVNVEVSGMVASVSLF